MQHLAAAFRAGLAHPLRRAAAVALGALALAQCNGMEVPPPVPAPVIDQMPPSPGEGGPRIFGGFIYPGTGSNAGTFEIDAPLRTIAGTPYYSFDITVRVRGLATPDLSWVGGPDGSTPIQQVEQVEGPCDPQAGPVERTFMHAQAFQHAGRRISASYNQEIDRFLDGGRSVFWVTCEPGLPGEVIQEQGALRVFYNLAVLVPDSVFATGATLSIVARNAVGGAASPPTQIPVQKTPTTVAVAGDSVAWGQGVPEGLKYYSRLFQDIVQRLGSGRLIIRAHSGAPVNFGSGSNLIANLNGCAPSSINGEIPIGTPTIQCQVRDLSRTRCRIPPGQLGVVPVPDFECGEPVTDRSVMVTFDLGPRYDFVFLNGCINDIGPIDLLLGRNNLDDPPTLINETVAQCDLRNGLGDLRSVLPNASITVMGYHLPVSRMSNVANTGCTTLPPAVAVLNPHSLVVVQLAIDGLKDGMAERSEVFRRESNRALESSVMALNQMAAGGRGTVLFVPMTGVFRPPHATLAPSPKTFGLRCTGTAVLAPEDPVAGTRATACTAFINPDGTNPNSAAEEGCLRASAFHPNVRGNQDMFEALRSAMIDVGHYPATP